jgi:Putative esterase
MIAARIRIALGQAIIIAFASLSVEPSFAGSTESQIVSRELRSENFTHSKVGTSPVRKMVLYLPAGYDGSSKRHPVIYFLPNPFGSYRFAFDQKDAQGLFSRAIASGVIGKFILVCVDMNAPLGASWYVNSPATGKWEDFMVKELVPYIDANFKKSLRGFKFDWARSDSNYDHVYANQAFTHKLNEFGIAHESEEYNGSWGEGNWGEDGRVYTEVLPFFRRHLIFNAR